MNLRPHQELAISMIRDSIRKGNRKPILAAPCSFGKTITAASILKSVQDKGKRGIFICDRVKLVSQTLDAFTEHGIDFGVIQGQHELQRKAPIQIASIQTLARRRVKPVFDLAIVDECHIHYKALTELMAMYNNVIFIGLSATPLSKGLGVHYDDLLVPITPRELLSQGYLCPIDYYGGRNVSLKGIKTKQLPTGGSDYDPKSLSEATEQDEGLVGDIVENWKTYGNNGLTIAFTPSIKHSKSLVDTFNAAGISSQHIDGYMDQELRDVIFAAHARGEFLVLSCSRLLNTGFDSPGVSVLIDAFPTKSKIVFCQRAGRIARTSPGKKVAIYLDHAGNVARHGFSEDIIPESLDDGEKRYDENKLVKKIEKTSTAKDCPVCTQLMVGLSCKCGFEIPITEQLETTSEILKKLTPEQRNKTVSKEDKTVFYSELLLYARGKGYKNGGGWASHTYKNRFGVWPNAIKPQMIPMSIISEPTLKYIKSTQIRYSKRSDAA